MKDAEFKAALRAARQEVLEAAVSRLQAVTNEAVSTLLRALTCAVPSVEVSAARAMLEYAFRSQELEDLEARLTSLEQRFKEIGNVR